MEKLRVGDVVRITANIKYWQELHNAVGKIIRINDYWYMKPYQVRIISQGKFFGYTSFVFSNDEIKKLTEKEALAYLI